MFMQVVTEAQRGKVYRALIALERHGLEQNFVNELLLVLGENEDESSLTQIHDVISRRQAWFGDKAAKVKLLRVIAEQLSGEQLHWCCQPALSFAGKEFALPVKSLRQ
jgi:hypothetical protein